MFAIFHFLKMFLYYFGKEILSFFVWCKNQVPCPLVTVTQEEVDPSADIPVTNTLIEEECTTPPARVRMRSLSGGAYRLAPTLPATGRMRRQSGDDVLTRVSPSRRAALFEHFRPRSKSDSKGKRPTFLTSLKNSIFSPQRKTSLEAEPPPLEPLQPGGDYRQRSRSGSETRGGTMSKMIDLFRSRSNSLSIDSRSKKPLSSIVPPNALLRRHSVDPDKRRRPFSTYRSLEAHQAENFSCHTDEDTVDRIDYASLAEDKIIPTFLSSRTCYDVMPVSGKVVVLSVELLVKNAFEALVNNELRAAPLWDESISSFVGMLTISDFINVLRHYYSNSPENIKDIESQSISTWRKINRISKPVVKINATDNLAQATKLLIEEGVHRVPVLDEGGQCSFFVLTRKNLLHYLYNNIMQRFGNTIVRTPSFLSKTIRELGVGTFSDIAKVTFDTKVIEALDLFVQRKVSGLPIVDENNTLLDIFAKFDVFALAKEQTYHNLDMTINEAIDKGKVHEDVYGCTLDDTLGTVIRTIVTSKAHRLVVIDENKSVVGIVSLSDILKFLVVQPLSKLEDAGAPSTDIIEEAPEGAVGGTECDDNVFLDAKPKSCETPDEEDEQDEENSSKVKRDSVAEEEEE
ncbi:5'-AMP-activated protein kinase subunit gamma-2 isoform X3 [Parasteatoda tepidariorum]|uniref:5'-AMP-activated protein kinase subunit gamma-2 isoform X3 n=1 Tax=Parasteatoda tepidariorum TaxID=114398 RepID=UPI001C727112|nr:5'-AMP-activated protein kinase subunit gamma isoform X3 [Parasteatoda tepidariorum]